MVRILSLKELAPELSDTIELRYGGSVTWTAGETITGGTSGATAFIELVNSDAKILSVIPTSDAFFEAMENITAPSQTTPVPVLPSEITMLSTWEKTVKAFIEKYTNNLFGETKSVTKKITVEQGDRYFYLPRNSTITSIKLDGKTLTEGTDYYYNASLGQIDFNTELPNAKNPNNLEITYTYGETTVPENVKQAGKILVSELWKRRNHNNDMRGASSISFGGKSVSFSAPVHDKELEGLLPLISALLKRSSRFNFE